MGNGQQKRGIAHRTILSAFWKASSNAASITILFARAVILARLLPVEVFGSYGFAWAIISISLGVAHFGINPAMIHRSEVTEDTEQAARGHFTLIICFSTLWYVLLMLYTFFFSSGEIQLALLIIGSVFYVNQFAVTSRYILVRQVNHRPLAIIDISHTIVGTAVSIVLAAMGAGIWALLSLHIVVSAANLISFFVIMPVWRPRLEFKKPVIRYYLNFGRQNMVANILSTVISRIDDLWAGATLGNVALGLYSRAYTFAGYPAKVLRPPVAAVAMGTFSELKHDRLRLSKAFFRSTAFLVRGGFLVAGILWLAAPEFIAFLGDKWLPMLSTFRLMLVYALIEPIKTTLGRIFIACGDIGSLIRIRLVQLTLLVALMLFMTPASGIDGIAIAVNIMTVFGLGALLWKAKRFVDYSLPILLGWPALGVALSLPINWWISKEYLSAYPDWLSMIIRVSGFCVLYGLVLLITERERLFNMAGIMLRTLRSKSVISSDGSVIDSKSA